jgi:hypothetical protein
MQLFPTRKIIAALLAALLVISGQAAAVDVIISDVPASKGDQRRQYSYLLLRAVLERTAPEFGPYKIEHAPAHMERPRMLAALKMGTQANVTTYPADAEWLRELKVVPIPIDMGLQSWRIFLIDAKNQPRLRAMGEAGQLNTLRAGAGSAWVSANALRDNGLPVVAGGSYTGLFQMLMAGRFDYFPRGLNEIYGEFDVYSKTNPTLAVEESLLLHDNIPSFFFVAPSARRLHRRLNTGMEAMLKDGSLERLLLTHFKADLERAKLCTRKRIELPNRLIGPTMLARKEMWFDPFDPRHGLCPATQNGAMH